MKIRLPSLKGRIRIRERWSNQNKSMEKSRATNAFHSRLDKGKTKQQERIRRDYGTHVGAVKHYQQREIERRGRGRRFQRSMKRDITGKRYEW